MGKVPYNQEVNGEKRPGLLHNIYKQSLMAVRKSKPDRPELYQDERGAIAMMQSIKLLAGLKPLPTEPHLPATGAVMEDATAVFLSCLANIADYDELLDMTFDEEGALEEAPQRDADGDLAMSPSQRAMMAMDDELDKDGDGQPNTKKGAHASRKRASASLHCEDDAGRDLFGARGAVSPMNYFNPNPLSPDPDTPTLAGRCRTIQPKPGLWHPLRTLEDHVEDPRLIKSLTSLIFRSVIKRAKKRERRTRYRKNIAAREHSRDRLPRRPRHYGPLSPPNGWRAPPKGWKRRWIIPTLAAESDDDRFRDTKRHASGPRFLKLRLDASERRNSNFKFSIWSRRYRRYKNTREKKEEQEPKSTNQIGRGQGQGAYRDPQQRRVRYNNYGRLFKTRETYLQASRNLQNQHRIPEGLRFFAQLHDFCLLHSFSARGE